MARGYSTGNFMSAGDVTNGLDAKNTDVLIVSLWVYPTTSGADRALIGKWSSTVATLQWGCGILNTDKAYMQWSDGVTLNQVATSSFTVPTNAWTHLYFDNRQNASGGPVIGVNGALAAITGTGRTIGPQDTSIPLLLGYRNSATSPYFGYLSDVAVWNIGTDAGGLPSAAELNALYRGMPVHMYRPSYLVGYWPQWGKSSVAADPDLSGGGHAVFQNGTGAVAEFGRLAPYAPIAY